MTEETRVHEQLQIQIEYKNDLIKTRDMQIKELKQQVKNLEATDIMYLRRQLVEARITIANVQRANVKFKSGNKRTQAYQRQESDNG